MLIPEVKGGEPGGTSSPVELVHRRTELRGKKTGFSSHEELTALKCTILRATTKRASCLLAG